MTRIHADGTTCLEGSRRVPRGFRPCCEGFAQRVVACTSDIRYEWWTRLKTWVIVIDGAAGGGGVAFAHRPTVATSCRPRRVPAAGSTAPARAGGERPSRTVSLPHDERSQMAGPHHNGSISSLEIGVDLNRRARQYLGHQFSQGRTLVGGDLEHDGTARG